jgi:hypothetical protein
MASAWEWTPRIPDSNQTFIQSDGARDEGADTARQRRAKVLVGRRGQTREGFGACSAALLTGSTAGLWTCLLVGGRDLCSDDALRATKRTVNLRFCFSIAVMLRSLALAAECSSLVQHAAPAALT